MVFLLKFPPLVLGWVFTTARMPLGGLAVGRRKVEIS